MGHLSQTHTISGTPDDPGIIYRLMQSLFDRIEAKKDDTTVELSVSYLECVRFFFSLILSLALLLLLLTSPCRIYNETIQDLLVETHQGKPLHLRESEQRVVVPGLSEHLPQSAEQVLSLIQAGNERRTTNATGANATSSRSHAVLSVNLKMRPRTADLSESYSLATLSVIDLAGSERACVTHNKGARLHEGANINRSLLALGNCIKALCDPKAAHTHVPFRDSKLTRLLKHSLTGNCRTQLIVCVSPSSQHYDETYNTLQYANKAKDIQTKVQRNVISVDRHVSQYVRLIHELRQEIQERKKDDASRDAKLKAADKREREQAHQQATAAAAQLVVYKDSLASRVANAASARGQLGALDLLHQALLEWQRSVSQQDTARTVAMPAIDHLLIDLGRQLQSLSTLAADLEEARQYFNMQVRQARQRMHQPDALASFDRDCTVLQLELDVLAASAREQGLRQAQSAQLQAFSVLSEVRVRYSLEGGEAQVLEKMGEATDMFARRLCGTATTSSTPTATFPSAAIAAPSASSSLSAATAPPTAAVSAPRLSAPRPSTASTAPFVPAPKETVRSAAAGQVHVPGTSPQRKKQKKSVIWRDEAGTGLDLEEEGVSASAIQQDAGPSGQSEPATAAAAGGNHPLFSTSAAAAAAPRLSAASVGAKARASSSRMRTGFLGVGRLSVIRDEEGSGLPSRASSPRPSSSSSATGPAFASRTHSSAGDTSIASVNSSFDTSQVHHTRSSMLKAAHGRRMSTVSKNNRRSSIGPVKSLKQPARRPSQAAVLSTNNSSNSSSIGGGSRPTGAENESANQSLDAKMKPGSGVNRASGPGGGSGKVRAPGRASLRP